MCYLHYADTCLYMQYTNLPFIHLYCLKFYNIYTANTSVFFNDNSVNIFSLIIGSNRILFVA